MQRPLENSLEHSAGVARRDVADDAILEPLGGFPRLCRAEYEMRMTQTAQHEALLSTDDYQNIMTGMRFFRELFTAIKIDPKYRNQDLLKGMFTLVMRIQSEEIMNEFAYILFNFYSHDGTTPIPEFIAWAEETILRIEQLSPTALEFLIPFVRLLEETHEYAQCLLNGDFFRKLASFIGHIPDFDKLVIDLLISYAANSSLPDDTYIGFLMVIDVLLAAPTMPHPDVALNATNIIYETICALDDREAPILAGICDGITAKLQLLWNISQDVNDNLFMIMRRLPTPALMSMVTDPVVEILNHSALELRNCEAIRLLGTLARTHRHWDPILPEISAMIFSQGYSVATAAAIAMSGFMEGNPELFHMSFSVDCDDSEMNPNPMNFARATHRALALEDTETAEFIMHGLGALYAFFRRLDQTHPFTEMLDDERYGIKDQISEYLANDDEDIRTCAEWLILTIEGEFTCGD